MAKSKDIESEDLTLDEQSLADIEDVLDDTDYIFVVSSTGQLKNVVFPPDEEFEYSKELMAVFEVFGINSPDQLMISDKIIH